MVGAEFKENRSSEFLMRICILIIIDVFLVYYLAKGSYFIIIETGVGDRVPTAAFLSVILLFILPTAIYALFFFKKQRRRGMLTYNPSWLRIFSRGCLLAYAAFVYSFLSATDRGL